MRLKAGIGLLACMLMLLSCKSRRQTMVATLEGMVGREVIFEAGDTVLYDGKPKIVILIADTADCDLCHMQVAKWRIYKLDLENFGRQTNIVYVLNDSINLTHDVDAMLAAHGLHYVRGPGLF